MLPQEFHTIEKAVILCQFLGMLFMYHILEEQNTALKALLQCWTHGKGILSRKLSLIIPQV